MKSDWLHAFLLEAVNKRLCTKIFCTTCGAMEFRTGVLAGLEAGCDDPRSLSRNRDSVMELADALSGVDFQGEMPDGMIQALRCLIFDMWSGIPILDQEVEARLGDSLAGFVLSSMKKHHAEREAARAKHSPEIIKARREEKKLIKQEQHIKRLARKEERDRLWKCEHRADSSEPSPINQIDKNA